MLWTAVFSLQAGKVGNTMDAIWRKRRISVANKSQNVSYL